MIKLIPLRPPVRMRLVTEPERKALLARQLDAVLHAPAGKLLLDYKQERLPEARRK